MKKGLKWKTEVRRVGDLKGWEDNPRVISEDKYKELKESVGELGNFEPLVVDTDGTVIAGNQRLRVHIERGDEEVEVSVPSRELTEEEIKKIGIISNRHSGEWDMDKLANEFEDILEDLGFDDLLPEEVLDTEEDDYEEPEDLETTVVLGDIYQLGGHRLMCGDSTSITNIDKLLNDNKIDMIYTDPPYGMNLDTDFSGMKSKIFKGGNGGNEYDAGIVDDFSPEMINTIMALDIKETFLWGADYFAELLPNKNDGSWIVWDKRANGNDDIAEDYSSDKMYGSCFELCWSRTKHKRDIARVKWAGMFGMEKQDNKKRLHPTQKPLELCNWFITRYSKDDSNILDLFGGSGSTLMACEQLNRKCYMMELDPHYCQVIIDRWEKFTGNKAIKL